MPLQDPNNPRRYLHSTSTKYEFQFGYSRAVRHGRVVRIAGTAGLDENGQVVSDDVVDQMRRALEIIKGALEDLGSSLGDVIMTRIAAGAMFGPDTDVDLRLADIPPMIDKAKGIVMELEDGAYPLLARVSASADRAETHRDADWVLLVGSVPRGPGMERGDLIRKNGPIFVEEGKAIARHAAQGVRVVVVGNPCNTNCLIARANARSVTNDRWSAMTRLDQNRARSLLANKAAARVKDVKKLAIWGNHSATLYPDFTNATVNGKAASEAIDRGWLEKDFIPAVQQRGAAVIAARGASSAFSAAQALVDHVRSLVT